jgi:hypothetical protein
VVVVQVRDDHVRHFFGRDVDRFQPLGDRLQQRAIALLRHLGIEPGIDHDGPGRADDRPDIEVERIVHVVRIAADVVLGRLAVMVAVSDGIDFVDVVGHAFLPPFVMPGRQSSLRRLRKLVCVAGHPCLADADKDVDRRASGRLRPSSTGYARP